MKKHKLSILLCEDMDEYVQSFIDKQEKYFHVEVCKDIHYLPQFLREREQQEGFPDLLLLDLFSIRSDIQPDDVFTEKRKEIDGDVETIRQLIIETSKKARQILKPHGLHYLRIIRKRYPDYVLPVLLYSRLGPYILNSDEASVVEEFDADFLLKLMDHAEQRKKIERFHAKWRSPLNPVPLEIARKLATLPTRLAASVGDLLKAGKYRAAVLDGLAETTRYIHGRLRCTGESSYLRDAMVNTLLVVAHPEEGEDRYQLRCRITSVADLYLSLYRLKRNRFVHEGKELPWLEADITISGLNMLWREIDRLLDY